MEPEWHQKGCTIFAYSRKNVELGLQHMQAISDFLTSTSDFCLVLEDDTILASPHTSQFPDRIIHCIDSAASLGEGFYDLSDSLSLSSSELLDISLTHPFFSLMSPGQTRCSSSYLLTRQVAQALVSHSFPLVLPIDWHLSYLLSLLSVPTYWYSQPLFSQGSQTGHFDSNQFSRGL